MMAKNGTYYNIGNVNDRLTFQINEPVLHYDNGMFHTSIHFKCAPIKSSDDGKLVLLKRVKNRFYFDYYTTLACLHTVHCAAWQQDDSQLLSYDLSSLKNYEDDVDIVKGNVETLISVCKPLVNQPGWMAVGCPPGSGICKKITNQKKEIMVIIFQLGNIYFNVKASKYSSIRAYKIPIGVP